MKHCVFIFMFLLFCPYSVNFSDKISHLHSIINVVSNIQKLVFLFEVFYFLDSLFSGHIYEITEICISQENYDDKFFLIFGCSSLKLVVEVSNKLLNIQIYKFMKLSISIFIIVLA